MVVRLPEVRRLGSLWNDRSPVERKVAGEPSAFPLTPPSVRSWGLRPADRIRVPVIAP